MENPSGHSEETGQGFDTPTKERPILVQYYEEGNSDKLREHVKQSIDNKSFSAHELIELAKSSKEAASLVKELINANRIDETELADRIAREIIGDIEDYVDLHLEKYHHKFTLNAPQLCSTVDGSKAKFFNLISLLKDVSILGRKLLETAPRFDSSKPRTPREMATVTNTNSNTNKSADKRGGLVQASNSNKGPAQRGDTRSQMSEEDATSEDLLAALIESSSTDDFLVLSSSLDTITIRDMMIAALVLITSHECFTLSHNIQGVVMVLRRSKFMINNILAPKNQMELVTRLLTAIGRYNEMSYVFDLFRDRNQFEILLSKGVEKTPELRIALYNYVKINPEFYALVTLNFSMFREIAESLESSARKRLDKLIHHSRTKKEKAAARKKVSLIIGSGGASGQSNRRNSSRAGEPVVSSLHHQLGISERVAQQQQQQQQQQNPPPMRKSNSIATSLSSIGSGGAGCCNIDTSTATNATGQLVGGSGEQQTGASSSNNNNSNNKPLYSRDNLKLCLVELVDASDCYARAGCYKRSNDCANRAKLVALQLAHLAHDINLLDLQQAELDDTIVSLERFLDAHIVAHAYDYHLTWRQALFRNVVLRGSTRYLDEFCSKCDLSEPLVMELVLLYRQYLANNRLSVEEQTRVGAAMRSILKRGLTRVALKCQLFTEFKFDDAKEELLQNPSVRAHLKDLKLA